MNKITNSRFALYQIVLPELVKIPIEIEDLLKNISQERGKNDVFTVFLGTMNLMVQSNRVRIYQSLYFDQNKDVEISDELMKNSIQYGRDEVETLIPPVTFSFIVNTFHIFEDFITTIFESIILEKEMDNIRTKKFRKILLDAEIGDKIVDRLAKDCIGKFIPLEKKLHSVLEKINLGAKVSDDIKKFIEFLTGYRNSIHSNSVYSGRAISYFFHGERYELKKGMPLTIVASHIPMIVRRCIYVASTIYPEVIKKFPDKKIKNKYKSIIDPE